MKVPEGRLYSEYHLWVEQEPVGLRIGMTHCGCEYLGSVDYVELPSPGQAVLKDSPFGWVETSKAITELLAPVSGTVVESNEKLSESPEMITADSYGSGWLILIRGSDASEVAQLMTPEEYRQLVSAEA
jgi:glycine cleavage system H protein